MISESVVASLRLRWPDAEYLLIEEAPDSVDRQGRRLDLLVCSLWPSRGLTLEGVEIKVSLSDWTREVKNAEKAEWWWQHTNRFWVAVPKEIAAKVQETLPPTWGLLACEAGKAPKVIKQAPSHHAEPIGWNATLGLLRAAAGAGRNALLFAEHRGRDQARKDVEARRGPSIDEFELRELRHLKTAVDAFEQASGVKVTAWGGPRIGAAVRTVMQIHARGVPSDLAMANARSAIEQAKLVQARLEDVLGLAEKVRDAIRSEQPPAAPEALAS